ncbi:MAG TPA: cytochrome c [Jatrophihabitantaceae bacterium]|nr:cytochrome c [Jatrophihabitantaceae bacterium]
MKDDFDDPLTSADLGFEPAVPVTGADPQAKRNSRRRGGLRRKLTAGAILTGALVGMGGAYTLFAGTSGAADSTSSASDIAAGRQLYEVSCITCHGANLQGVKNRGVSLLGVGGAAVYFQVSTGRMPATGQGSEQYRKTAKFTDQQIRQLAAFVQSKGGGVNIPAGTVRGTDADIAEGGNLFRLNCASCHGTTFKGAPLTAGKSAPSLNASTDLQIYTAMLTGPESMPIFSDNEITPDEKRAIVAYIQTIKASDDPGGSGIDRIGPVSEAIVIWVAGIGAIMIAILWIGAKTQ